MIHNIQIAKTPILTWSHYILYQNQFYSIQSGFYSIFHDILNADAQFIDNLLFLCNYRLYLFYFVQYF